ncbi:MAG: dockerin type I domain-containing protein, partial [Chloroflexia bacterium]
GAPPNGGTVTVGDRFVFDLMVDARDYAAPNGLGAQQSYMTFTAGLLQNARVADIGTSCVPTGTLTADTSVFDASLQNEVCNGPSPCIFRGVTVGPGSIAYASGGLTNCPQGCPDPSAPPPQNQSLFRVAQIGFCAMGQGRAVIRWEFSPPASIRRDTELVDHNSTVVNNRACYSDYVINIVNPELVGHVTIQGRPAQPNALQSVPITLTLKVSGGGAEYDYNTNTDASGYFTVTAPGPGLYDWRVKNPQTLARSGSVTLVNGANSQEMGLLLTGDCNNSNVVEATDFTILKTSFGKSQEQPGYDDRADLTGDTVVNAIDFTLLRANFGIGGAPPIGP